MKTISRLFIALFSLFLATEMSAQCTAGFTWTQTSSNVISFTNTSSPILPNSSYWDFGDNQYDWTTNPVHTYSIPGTYYVCLYMWDSLSMCQASYCDTVTVTGNVLCNVTAYSWQVAPASCSSCADGSASAQMSNGTAPYTYSWSSGGTTQTVSGLLPGTYAVCITDANGCTACDSVVVGTQGPCVAGFNWTQTSNNVISFTNTSSPNTPNSTNYYWDFGDNQSDWNTNPVHTYSAPGTYYVCLYMWDSLSMCQASYCDTITVTGNVLCNVWMYTWQVSPATCSSCADGSASAQMSNGTAPYTYSWSNGGTTQTVSGLLPGTYAVCITDANGCIACDSVVIGTQGPCVAGFTWTQTSPNVISFTNTSSPNTPNSTGFYWDFGDNQYDWNNNPIHTYSTPGTYYACLYMWDSLSMCQGSYCDTIVVTGNVLCNMTAYAAQLNPATCSSCSDGSASVQPWNGTAPYTYAWSNGGTTQSIFNLAPGTYAVCITDANGCTACDSVTIGVGQQNQTCSANFVIYLDSVNSNLAWVYNYSTGSPAMQYQWYWGDNTVDTGAYPTHVYTQTGSYNICLVVVDQANNCTDTMCQLLWVPRLSQQAAMAPFYVNVLPPLGIEQVAEEESWTIYPNPANEFLNVTAPKGNTYTITDMSGRQVAIGTVDAEKIDISGLDNGAYFFTITSEDGKVSTKMFVRN